MRKVYLFAIGLLAAAVLWAGQAMAGTTNAYLYVYSNVIPVCYMYTSDLYFPDYAANFMNADGAVYVSCNTAGHQYSIALDAGYYYNGSTRQMYDGNGHYLQYEIADPTYSFYWGDDGATHFGSSVIGTATGGFSYDGYAVKGLVWSGQASPAGWYYDYVYVTVTY